MMTPTFLPLSSDTVETALASMRTFYTEEALEYREPRARDALQQLLKDPSRGGLWFIETDGVFIGYFVLTLGFSLEFAGRFALLDEFYVEPAHRGRGIGAQALEFIQFTAESLGVAAIRLEVDRANPRLESFYRRAGFEAHDRNLMTKWLAKSSRRSSIDRQ
jgi:GNAT superfamily N-acetyltransferase